jgi:RNA polymerase sigma-70 factor (ECF subfamily)
MTVGRALPRPANFRGLVCEQRRRVHRSGHRMTGRAVPGSRFASGIWPVVPSRVRHTYARGGHVVGMRNPSRAPDREARFTLLYEAAYADLLRFAQRRVHPTHAEDVVAESFLVAWRRLDDLPPRRDDARAWLFGIVRGVILNTHRGAERQQALAVRLADVPALSTADADADLVARQIDVSRAWQRLPDMYQEALALAVLDGLSAPQAAAVLGVSPVAFRLRLSRARRALRLHLDHPAGSPSRPVRTPERTRSS